jgi:hypothetical protein
MDGGVVHTSRNSQRVALRKVSEQTPQETVCVTVCGPHCTACRRASKKQQQRERGEAFEWRKALANHENSVSSATPALSVSCSIAWNDSLLIRFETGESSGSVCPCVCECECECKCDAVELVRSKNAFLKFNTLACFDSHSCSAMPMASGHDAA